MPPPTRAKRRMDKLMRHLTALPASESLSPSKLGTPQKQELRRELASAQRDRVKQEYGYELLDEANEPFVQVASDLDDSVSENTVKRLRHDDLSLSDESNDPDIVSNFRLKLAKACKLAWMYEVAGSKTDEDSASVFVPGHGFLYKPLGIRFNEVSANNLVLTTKKEDLPKIHADLYASCASTEPLCILSAAHDDCCLVSVTKEGLLPLCQDSIRLYGRIKRVDDQNIGMRASRSSYKGTLSWLVKNRGVVCCDKSVESTLSLLILTARSCTFQVRALAAVGGDLNRLDLPSESETIRIKADLQSRVSDVDVAKCLFEKGM